LRYSAPSTRDIDVSHQQPATGTAASPDKTVLLAGATGLVGDLCLRRLLAKTSTAERVVAVVRRPPAQEDARLQVLETPFDQLPGHIPVPARAALCALGTTMAQAGSQDAFRQVDHDAVVAFARWARAGGVTTFVLVSSAGAAPGSRTFYLRVKGEAEEAVAAVGFPRVVVLRPGVLIGPRRETRRGDAIAQRLMPLLKPLMAGPLRRFRAISADTVAAAMIAATATRDPGRHVWHNQDIEAAAHAPAPQAA
jgi:uncharacterized protein YbjT (DUF2867 family)